MKMLYYYFFLITPLSACFEITNIPGDLYGFYSKMLSVQKDSHFIKESNRLYRYCMQVLQ